MSTSTDNNAYSISVQQVVVYVKKAPYRRVDDYQLCSAVLRVACTL
jgi:hypothetical protein